jgi:hypothetical protein
MTGLLNDVMHERADAAAAPHLDLDAIMTAGARRVRRRRAVTGLAAAAVAVTAAAGGLAATSMLGSGDELVPQAPVIERGPAYAVGGTITVGARSYTVPHDVASLVQTDDGLLYTSPDGRVWLYDGTGSTHVGHAEGHRLRTDDTGSLAAWVDLADDGHPQYVVYDTSDRSEVARVDDQAAGASLGPGDHGAQVFAVDDGAVYWRHDAALVRYDVGDAEESLVSDRVSEIADVAAGRIGYVVDGRGNHRWGIAVGDRVDHGDVSLAEASHGALSPDGRLLAAEEYDAIAVYATVDGQDVTPEVDGYRYVVAFGWVDDDVAAVLALSAYDDSSASGDVLACDISDDTCTTVSSFDRVDPERLVLGVGDPVT